jgi:hypothetical protein
MDYFGMILVRLSGPHAYSFDTHQWLTQRCVTAGKLCDSPQYSCPIQIRVAAILPPVECALVALLCTNGHSAWEHLPVDAIVNHPRITTTGTT